MILEELALTVELMSDSDSSTAEAEGMSQEFEVSKHKRAKTWCY